MITEKLLQPYVLASQDVIVHATFYIIFLLEYYDIRKVHDYSAATG